ncbi:MAG: PAS domain S-box protein [Desulfomonilaceae bacterium]|nr:PAS domain S-box protein [Desulfomonilaceae bacterium]
MNDRTSGNTIAHLSQPSYRYVPLLVVLCIGIAAAIAAFQLLSSRERNEMLKEFDLASQRTISLLAGSWEDSKGELESIAALFHSSEDVTRAEFRGFVGRLLTRPKGIQALVWAPRLDRLSRNSFVDNARQEGLPTFEITVKDPSGKLVASPRKNEYFPMYYVEPREGNEALLGFDPSSDPARAQCLTLSRDTGEIVATARLKPVGETTDQYGFLACVPTYRKDALTDTVQSRWEHLTGFCLAVFRIDDFVEHALAHADSAGVDLYLFDESSPPGERFLYFHSSTPGRVPEEPVRDRAGLMESTHYAGTIHVGRREWFVVCKPSPEFSVKRDTILPWLGLISGLMFTGLVVGYIRTLQAARLKSESFAAEQLEARQGLEREINRRQRTEQELAKERNRAQNYLDVVEVIIVALNQAGEVTMMNRKGRDLLGYDQEEVVGRNWFELVVPERERDRVKEVFSRMMAGERELVRYFENAVLTNSGDERFIAWHNTVLTDEQGGIMGTLSSGSDISERKRTENALRESEEFNRTIVELAPLGILYLDSAGTILYANKASDRILGVPDDEPSPAVGKNLCELLESRNLTHVVDHVRALLAGRPIEDLEFTCRFLTDKEISLAVSGAPRYGSDGTVVGAVLMYTDISGRKREEEARLRLVTAIEQAAETVVITDDEARILYVNPAFELITGYGKEEVLGRNPRLLKSGKQDETFYKHMWDVLHRGHVWSGRLINKKKDGTVYEEDATISPVTDKSGKVINYVAVKRDVTAEVMLRKQVQQGQKMESIGTLAGGIAHDFNNLLTIVQGYSELLLLSMPKDSPGHYEAEAIHQAAVRGTELVRRILTFSRRTEIHPRPVNLNNEVKQTERLLYSTIPKMIKMEVNLADDLKSINADPGQIEQILLNLAVNARDAMPNGGRLIIETRNEHLDEEYCRTHFDGRPGEYAMLLVSDTGHGMTGDVMEHIFEPFFTTKKVGEGTGLGLAMVYGIVKGHGGHVVCYSEPNVGTTFRIFFPVLKTVETADTATTQQMPAFGTETILLVDDEELIRSLGKRILSRSGYDVLEAAGGEEALEIYAARKDDISLVILDLIMPGMGGEKCLEELLEMDPAVKVLIASGHSASLHATQALKTGARAFVGKPFDTKHLLRTVRKILDEKEN